MLELTHCSHVTDISNIHPGVSQHFLPVHDQWTVNHNTGRHASFIRASKRRTLTRFSSSKWLFFSVAICVINATAMHHLPKSSLQIFVKDLTQCICDSVIADTCQGSSGFFFTKKQAMTFSPYHVKFRKFYLFVLFSLCHFFFFQEYLFLILQL